MEKERIRYISYFVRWEFLWRLWQAGISTNGVESENRWLFMWEKLNNIGLILRYEKTITDKYKSDKVIYWEDVKSEEVDGEIE